MEAVRSEVDDVCHELSMQGWLFKPLLFASAYMRTGIMRCDAILGAKDRKHPFDGLTEQDFIDCRDMTRLAMFSSPEAALGPCVDAGFYVLAKKHVDLSPHSPLIVHAKQ